MRERSALRHGQECDEGCDRREGPAQEFWPDPDENDTGERRDQEQYRQDQGTHQMRCLTGCCRVV